MLKCVGIFVFTKTFGLVDGQADGNPHGWDRKRRCDEQDYNPPCGICEGTGGIPHSDTNADIRLTTCEKAEQPTDKSTLKKPIMADSFKVKEYFEVLIGKKNDPFCFQSFPGNDSVGELCYRAQQGSQVYDSTTQAGLRYDVEVVTVVGNVSTFVIHHSEYMWIVNHFPWYAAGLHQCICTEPRQGGDWTTPKVYPLQYNWTNHLSYVGREKLGIEYIWTEKIVDHWAFGPHHVWTYPESGQILRMWQPFNGLEVFPDGLGKAKVDDADFGEMPPKFCTKDAPFGTIKVKCQDDGYPVPHTALSADSNDLRRARAKVPRDSYRGNDFTRMSEVLNKWLSKDGIQMKDCADWTADDLKRLQAQLYLLRNEDLDKLYQSTRDNRRMRQDVQELERLWREDGMLALEHGLQEMHRDGHCHEAVMWYVHHLDEDSKAALRQAQVQIPTLSHSRHECAPSAADGHLRTCRAYEEKVTCASCHSGVYPTSEELVV